MLLLLLILFFVFPNYKKLDDPRNKDRVGALYEMIDLNDNPSAPWWILMFCLRRGIFAVGVVFLEDYPLF